MEAIKKRLAIMDTTAFSLCMENNVPVLVFNLYKKGNIKILDGGCATGLYSHYFKSLGYNVIGVDKSKNMLKKQAQQFIFNPQ